MDEELADEVGHFMAEAEAEAELTAGGATPDEARRTVAATAVCSAPALRASGADPVRSLRSD